MLFSLFIFSTNWDHILSYELIIYYQRIINNIGFQCQAENLFQNDFKKIVKKKKETRERENGSKCDHGHLLLL